MRRKGGRGWARLLAAGLLAGALSGAPAGAQESWDGIVPPDIEDGENYRILFVTDIFDGTRSNEIGTWNTFVQAQAAGVTAFADISGDFRVLGSTAGTNVRVNTATRSTDDDGGVPVYWYLGERIADDYDDLYDDQWASVSPTQKDGSAYTGFYVWTGTRDRDETSSTPLSATGNIMAGLPTSASAPFQLLARAGPLPVYALSGVLTAPTRDSAPSFGGQTVDETYTAGEAVSLVLPAATGGNGVLAHALTGTLPEGLAFDATTRTISGIPLVALTRTEYTLTATDADENTETTDAGTLTFHLAVTAAHDVCSRTNQVRDALTEAAEALSGHPLSGVTIAGANHCAAVSEHDLGQVTELTLTNTGLTALTAADIADLDRLTALRLNQNTGLDSLPSLTDLADTLLVLHLGLTGIDDADVVAADIDSLTNLRDLRLNHTNLDEQLPAGFFEDFTALRTLKLHITEISGGTFSFDVTPERTTGGTLGEGENASLRVRLAEGAPFRTTVTWTAAGDIAGTTTGTAEIPAGALVSEPFAVTGDNDDISDAAVTVTLSRPDFPDAGDDDLADNRGNVTGITIDNTAPVLSLTFANDDPPAVAIDDIAGDNVINKAEHETAITVSGTYEAAAGGSVTVAFSGTSETLTATTDGDDGAWAVDIPANAAYIVDGTVTVTVTVVKTGAVASLPATKTVTVDLTAPTVDSAEIATAPPDGQNEFYKLGDSIGIRVTFSEDVEITGVPTLPLTVGGDTDKLHSGAPAIAARSIAYSYEVDDDDLDADGLAIPTSLTLPSGAAVADAAGNPLVASLPAADSGQQAGHKVDGVVPSFASGPIYTSSNADPALARAGDTVTVDITFNEPVTRTTGTLPLSVTLFDGRGSIGITNLPRVTGSDVQLRGTRAIDASHRDGALEAAVFWTRDAAGNEFRPARAATGITIDNTAPVLSVTNPDQTSPGSSRVFRASDDDGTTTWKYKLQATGTCEAAVPDDASDYSEGADLTRDDEGDNGRYLCFWSTDAAGNVGSAASAQIAGIDTTPPAVDNDNVAVATDPGNDETYGAGEEIRIEVPFDDDISATGTITLGITVGSANRDADLVTPVSGSTLVFTYTTQADDEDTDGIGVRANRLELGTGATLRDAAGNDVAFETGRRVAITAKTFAAHKVDAAAPNITAVSLRDDTDDDPGDDPEDSTPSKAIAADGFTNDTEPALAFTSNEVGTYVSSGACGTLTGAVTADADNRVTFGPLADGAYSDCNVTVTDAHGNQTAVPVPTFSVDTVAPSISGPGDLSFVQGQTGISFDFIVRDTSAGLTDHSDTIRGSGFAGLGLSSDESGTGEMRTITYSGDIDADEDIDDRQIGVIARDAVGNENEGVAERVTLAIRDAGDVLVAIAGTPSATEGQSASFTVSRTVSQSTGLDVDWSIDVAGETATSGDVSATTGTIAIPANATEVSIDVETIDDTLNERDETFLVVISQPGGANFNIGTSQARGTINDNDAITVTVAHGDTEAAAEGEPARYAIGVGPPGVITTEEVVVTYDVAGAGDDPAEADDYTAPSGRIVVPVGATSASLKIETIDDTIAEDDEGLQVTLTGTTTAGAANFAAADAGGAATATINDNDRIFIRIAPVATTIAESEAVIFTATLELPDGGRAMAANQVTVDWAVSHGNTNDGDFSGDISGEVVLAAGENEKTVDVSIGSDALVEGNETFAVALSEPTEADKTFPGAVEIGTAESAAITIMDETDPPTAMTLTVDTDSDTSGDQSEVAENAGATTVTVTAQLGGSTTYERNGPTIHLAVEPGGGNPIARADYAADPAAPVITFGTGARASVDFTLTPANDKRIKGDRTLEVSGGATGFQLNSPQLITITEDDTPPTSIELRLAPPASVDENGGSQQVTVTAAFNDGGAALDGPTTITVSVAPDSGTNPAETSDFEQVADFTITIPAGETSAARTFDIRLVQDTEPEGTETLSVSGTVSGAAAALVTPITTATAARLTINDDDTPTFYIDCPESVDEGSEGTIEVTCTVTLEPAGTAAASVDISTLAGTATHPADYERLALDDQSFAAGVISRNFTVTVKGDRIDEDNETFQIEIRDAQGGGAVAAQIGSPSIATVIVTDDDERGVLVSQTDVAMDEGGTATYRVALATEPTANVTVSVTSTETDKVTVAPATLSFTPASWATQQDVTVTAVGDDDARPEEVRVLHEIDGSGTSDYATADPPLEIAHVMATVAEPVHMRGVTVSVASLSLTEGGEAGTYTVVLDAAPGGGAVVIDLAASGGGIAVSPRRLVFTAADWDDERTVTVTPVHDADANPASATITHRVSGVDYEVAGVTAPSVAVTVADNSVAAIVLSRAELSLAEDAEAANHAADYTVRLANAPVGTVTVTVSGDMAAVSVDPATVTFTGGAEGDWATPRTVTVRAAADTDGLDAALALTHTAQENGGEVYDDVAATLAITVTDDDESAPVAIDTSQSAPTPTGWTVTIMEKVDAIPVQLTLPQDHDDNVRLSVTEIDMDDPRLIAERSRMANPPPGFAFPSDGFAFVDIDLEVEAAENVFVVYDRRDRPVRVCLPVSDELRATAAGRPIQVLHYDENRVAWEVLPARADEGARVCAETTGFSPFRWGFLTGTAAKGPLARISRAILPEAARAMAASTVDAIRGRLEQAWSAVAGVSDVYHVLKAGAGQMERDTPPDWKRMAGSSSFVLPLAALEGGGAGATRTSPRRASAAAAGETAGANVTLWGTGDYRNLSGGEAGGVDWDGDVTSVYLGADARLRPDLVAGAALSRQHAAFDYAAAAGDGASVNGTHETRMTGIHPYVGWRASDDLEVWAAAGYGRGEVEIEDDAGQAVSGDATMRSLALGARGALLKDDRLIAGGETELRLRGEGWLTRLEVDELGPLERLSVDANRLRLALEGSHTHKLASGATLTPTLELGVRHDGGDGETGTGNELGGGVSWTDPARGLTVEGRGRTLLAHEGNIDEWGLSGLVRLDPGARGRGLSFSLAPSWGAAGSGVERLYRQGAMDLAPAANDNLPGGRLDLDLGYGIGTLGGRGLLTPFGGFSLGDGGGRDYRLGARFELGPVLDLDLEGTRRESANRDEPPEHGVMLRGKLRF